MITVVGNLNPAIFQPRWMAAVGALDSAEAESAEVQVISPAITLFTTTQFVVEVTTQSGSFSTRLDTDPAGLRDLVVRLFSELPHTPVEAIEMSHQRHTAENLGSWSALSAQLVKSAASQAVLPESSVRSLVFQRSLDAATELELVVEPSSRRERGIFCRIGMEFEIEDPDSGHSAADAIASLDEKWKAFVEMHGEISKSVLALGS